MMEDTRLPSGVKETRQTHHRIRKQAKKLVWTYEESNTERKICMQQAASKYTRMNMTPSEDEGWGRG